MSLRPGPHCPGFIEPALPSASRLPPSGSDWVHEIKFDGFRLLARRDGSRVRLFSRNGFDWSDRFPLIRAGMATLKVRSCLIDGEACCCEVNGVPSFELLRDRRHDAAAFLYAFDLIELDGEDLRREPLVTRKATLASVVAKASPGVLLNEHFEHDGPTVFAHACTLGLEGIVSKKKDSPYRSGRTPDWLKSKNPASPAAKRDAEGFDWGR